MTATKIIVSHYHHKREVETVTCATPEEARKVIEEGNATALEGWRWGLSDANWWTEAGVPMSIDEANEVRRACGCAEY